MFDDVVHGQKGKLKRKEKMLSLIYDLTLILESTKFNSEICNSTWSLVHILLISSKFVQFNHVNIFFFPM